MKPYIKQGKIRGLALTGYRLPDLPGVPTFIEKGYPQVDVMMTYFIIGSKGLPAEVIQVWKNALKALLEMPDVVTNLSLSFIPVDTGGSPAFVPFNFSSPSRLPGLFSSSKCPFFPEGWALARNLSNNPLEPDYSYLNTVFVCQIESYHRVDCRLGYILSTCLDKLWRRLFPPVFHTLASRARSLALHTP